MGLRLKEKKVLLSTYPTMPRIKNLKRQAIIASDDFPQQHNFSSFIQKVTDTAPSLIAVYDITTGEYIFINQALSSMLGYKTSEWKKRGVRYAASLVHPEDLPIIMDKNKKALERENSRKSISSKPVIEHFEYRVKHADGTWRWLHTYGTVFERTADKKVRYVLNVSLDITERRETEEKLRQTEELLRSLNEELENIVFSRTKDLEDSRAKLKEALHIAQMGSWEFDVETGKITWSDELFTIHGLDPKKGEPTYKEMLQLFDKPKVLMKSVKDALEKGIPYNIDVKIIRPDGTPRYIQAIGKPIVDKNGKCKKLYGATIDITTRKQTELNMEFLSNASKILSASLNYETTLNAIAKVAVPEITDWCSVDMLNQNGTVDQLVVAHKDPKKVAWAKKLRAQTPPDMSRPQGLPQVLRSGKSEFYPVITQEMLAAGAKNKKQLKLILSIGFTSAIIVPILVNKKAIGVITFVTTESRRQFTKSDFEMAEELGHRVSLAVENAKLYKEAQDAILLRDEFISVASHELKTPITSMKMYAQILEKLIKKEDRKDPLFYLAKINDQIQKQTKLISDLLNVSRLQVGKMEFQENLVNLEQLLRDIVESIQISTRKHKIIIKGNASIPIKADADRIEQVIINLITNAIKYSPRSDKVIVTLAQTEKSTKLSVQDFGIGIEKKYQGKVFDRFYQVQDPDEKTFPGLGIGLFISHEIIKRHGGVMGLKSEKGEGSTFYFTLPNKK